MRVNGNGTWLAKKYWKEFVAYEDELTELISDQQMIVLCTYPLAVTKAMESVSDLSVTSSDGIQRTGTSKCRPGSPDAERAYSLCGRTRICDRLDRQDRPDV
jgi:DcmR-like sensory protein